MGKLSNCNYDNIKTLSITIENLKLKQNKHNLGRFWIFTVEGYEQIFSCFLSKICVPTENVELTRQL